MSAVKRCPRCGRVRAAAEFYWRRSGRLSSYCKSCQRAAATCAPRASPSAASRPTWRPSSSSTASSAPRGIDLAAADRDDIEAYLAGRLARWKPATAANRYRALRVFYAWLEDEGEIPSDPMAKMRPPRVPDQPAPVLTEELLRRLLKTCEAAASAPCRSATGPARRSTSTDAPVPVTPMLTSWPPTTAGPTTPTG